MSEFNEPWRAGFASSEKFPVCVISSSENLNVGIICDIKDADRIVACVNFCRDVPTDWMLGHKIYRPPENMSDRKLGEMALTKGHLCIVEEIDE